LSAACNKDRLLCEENLKKAFNKIDSDRDGFISQKEMRKAFGISTDEISVMWKELLGKFEPED
jgi:Ca2+-binding EF-hand superfamily protein